MKLLAKKPDKILSAASGHAKRGLTRLVATQSPTQARAQKFPQGRLQAGQVMLRCALGAGGVRHDKREGDHATPAGSFRLLSGFYRADRIPRGTTRLPMRKIHPWQGWCDDSSQAAYNRLVSLPYPASHEKLWREDRLYDIVVVLDYNLYPRRKHRGSAIFMHCRRDGFGPTEGCIALDPDDLRRLLPRLSRKAVLMVK